MTNTLRVVMVLIGIALAMSVVLLLVRVGPRYRLFSVNDVTFTLEIPLTVEQRRAGLSGRGALAPDEGMLVSLTAPEVLTYSTERTPFAQDVVYLMANGLVVRIDHLAAAGGTPTISTSETPVWTALLLAGGATERANLRVGDRLELYPPSTKDAKGADGAVESASATAARSVTATAAAPAPAAP